MPQIPIYQQRTNATGNLGPGPESVRAPVENPLSIVAGGLQQVSDALRASEQQDAAVKAAEALANIRVTTAQRLQQAKVNPALNLDGFTPTILSDFDKDASKASNDSTLSPGVRRYFKLIMQQHLPGIRDQLGEDAIQWEAGQKVNQRIITTEQSQDKAKVAVELNPYSWQAAGAEQMAAIDALAVPPDERLRLKRRADTLLSEAAASGYAKMDPRGVLAKLQTAQSGDPVFDGLNVEARSRVQEIAKSQLVNQQATGIVQTYASAGMDAGTTALSNLSKSDLPADLQDDVRAKVNGAVSELRNQRRQEHVDDIASVESSIATDSASRSTANQVHSLYDVGALTPAEYGSYIAKIDSSIVQRNQNAAASQAIANALRSGLPLDPSNTEHRKALSAAFQHDATGLGVGSQQWQATAIGYADKARMLPDQASVWARQAMRSPDANLAASAAQFYGSVQTAAPDATSSFDDHTKAFAGIVNSMIESGTTPAKAVELARHNVFEQKAEVTKQREQQYAAGGAKSFAQTSDNALKQFIDRDFAGGWFSKDPTPVANLSADFNSKTQSYYLKTGDITLARSLAWDDLKHVYGVSEVNGTKQVMAFPPERFGVNPQDVRADIDDFLKANPQADGTTANDVYLVPDGLTLRAAGNALTGENIRPSYALVGKSGDAIVDQHGVQKRYTLPTGDELATRFKAAQDKATTEGQAIVNQARADREVIRQRAEQLRQGELR